MVHSNIKMEMPNASGLHLREYQDEKWGNLQALIDVGK